MAGNLAYTSIVSSSGKNRSTTVVLSDGTTKTFTGDRAFRNNNPGNLTGTAKAAIEQGALGVDYDGNYIFPSMQAGFNAQKQLVLKEYGNYTISEMLSKYAPPGADNDPYGTNASYPGYVKAAGFTLSDRISDLSSSDQEQLIRIMITKESEVSDDILALVNDGDRADLAEAVRRAELAEEGEDDVNSTTDNRTEGTTSQRNDQLVTPDTTGFKDPFKNYPRKEYFNQATTNKAARGEWEPKLKMGGGSVKGGSLFPTEANPQYPYNKVTETSSGHRIELDDTPGEERVSVVHTVGSGMEFHADGLVVLNAHDKMVQVVGDDFTVYVRGNGDITYEGDLKMHVTGDYKLRVDKNFILEVDGKYIETIGQGKHETVEADKISTIVGNLSESITKNSSRISLESANIITKGDLAVLTDGKAEYATSESTHLSSKTRIDIAAPELNATAEDLAIIAPEGQIGGVNMMYTGDTYKGRAFDGDFFTGISAEAVKSETAVNAQQALSAAAAPGAGGTGGTSPTGTVGTPQSLTSATSAMVKDTLERSDKGILNVDVDPDNKILQNIDLRELEILGENKSTTSTASAYDLVP